MLGRRALVDATTVGIALGRCSSSALRRIPEPLVIAAAGVLGILPKPDFRHGGKDEAVVFVCEHGSAKSLVAILSRLEGLLRRLGSSP